MPLEIKELVVKATLSDEATNSTATEQTASAESQSVNQALVKACVERVLEIIKQKSER